MDNGKTGSKRDKEDSYKLGVVFGNDRHLQKWQEISTGTRMIVLMSQTFT